MAKLSEHERRQRVLQMLDRNGRVQVGELADLFGVSPVTIRGDLSDLELQRMLRRVRGGAVVSAGADEGSFDLRLRHSVDAKRDIARYAATLVKDDEAIALDCSTTCYFLAKELLQRRGLVVLTNGLRAAMELATNDTFQVVLPAGLIRRSSWSLVGEFGDAFATHGTVSRGFFSVRSVSAVHGLMELSFEECQAKRQLVAACDEIYGLFDSSKVGRFALNSFATPKEVTGLVTDSGFSDELAAEWSDLGAGVKRVGLGTEAGPYGS